jgi:hypothetical protein
MEQLVAGNKKTTSYNRKMTMNATHGKSSRLVLIPAEADLGKRRCRTIIEGRRQD